jgi:hypothetical protein
MKFSSITTHKSIVLAGRIDHRWSVPKDCQEIAWSDGLFTITKDGEVAAFGPGEVCQALMVRAQTKVQAPVETIEPPVKHTELPPMPVETHRKATPYKAPKGK